MIEIKRVTIYEELTGIKALQVANLKSNLSSEEKFNEGFLTAEYSMSFLNQMHLEESSIIAKDGDAVVGYALVATQSIRHEHPLLASLFNVIDTLKINDGLFKDFNYVVVGQLCVAKRYRGQGLVQKMYNYYRESLFDKYQFCITDVNEKNIRSLKAHIKTGFNVIDQVNYGGDKWQIIAWDWRKK